MVPSIDLANTSTEGGYTGEIGENEGGEAVNIFCSWGPYTELGTWVQLGGAVPKIMTRHNLC